MRRFIPIIIIVAVSTVVTIVIIGGYRLVDRLLSLNICVLETYQANIAEQKFKLWHSKDERAFVSNFREIQETGRAFLDECLKSDSQNRRVAFFNVTYNIITASSLANQKGIANPPTLSRAMNALKVSDIETLIILPGEKYIFKTARGQFQASVLIKIMHETAKEDEKETVKKFERMIYGFQRPGGHLSIDELLCIEMKPQTNRDYREFLKKRRPTDCQLIK